MSEGAIESQGSETGVEGTAVAPPNNDGAGGGEPAINPAWNELLEVLPSQLHSLATPHLQKWDKNYQESLSKVHSQYEPYKPFIDNEIQPDQIEYALQLVQAIEARPAEVIKALQEWSGIQEEPVAGGAAPQVNPEQQGQLGDAEIPSELLNHPEIVKMKQMVDTMAQLLVQQNQTATQAQEDAALAKELTDLKAQHGEFDEEWVLTRAYNNPNVAMEKHVEAYREFEKGILAKARQPGPKVLGAGGNAPDNQVDVKTLDDKGRRSLVAQMLAASAQQNQ